MRIPISLFFLLSTVTFFGSAMESVDPQKFSQALIVVLNTPDHDGITPLQRVVELALFVSEPEAQPEIKDEASWRQLCASLQKEQARLQEENAALRGGLEQVRAELHSVASGGYTAPPLSLWRERSRPQRIVRQTPGYLEETLGTMETEVDELSRSDDSLAHLLAHSRQVADEISATLDKAE